MNDKTKKWIGWVLAGLISFVFVGSGIAKLMGGNAEMAKSLGGESTMMILGILELGIVVLFLVPKTGIIGSLLMIAYMGGAMAVHLTTGQSIVLQTIIQVMIWLVSAYRFPELLSRLKTADRAI